MSRILVVEDNDDNRALVVKVLGRQGHLVSEAVSAEEALEAAAESPPDLILLDLNLAGMSGFEAAGRALAAGCDGYISKPVDVRRLPDQVGEFLR